MIKYKFTGETQNFAGSTVNRIVAEIDIVDYTGNLVARKGTFGGWIEKESNLGHQWSCWVSNDAIVFQDAIVVGDAIVKDSCIVHGNAIIADDTVVKGVCDIYGHSRVSGSSNINGRIFIHGNAVVVNSIVQDNCTISGSAIVEDSKLKGYSVVSGCTRIKNGCLYTCRPEKCSKCECETQSNYYEVL